MTTESINTAMASVVSEGHRIEKGTMEMLLRSEEFVAMATAGVSTVMRHADTASILAVIAGLFLTGIKVGKAEAEAVALEKLL